jgi:hypothetical protein
MHSLPCMSLPLLTQRFLIFRTIIKFVLSWAVLNKSLTSAIHFTHPHYSVMLSVPLMLNNKDVIKLLENYSFLKKKFNSSIQGNMRRSTAQPIQQQGYRLHDWRTVIWLPVGARDFSYHYHIQYSFTLSPETNLVSRLWMCQILTALPIYLHSVVLN